MKALSWMGADAATIKAIQHASRRRLNCEPGLKRPQPWDVFVEVARDLRQNYVDDAIGALREAIEEQPNNAWMHVVLASLMSREADWHSAYDESSKAVKFAPQSPLYPGAAFLDLLKSRAGSTSGNSRQEDAGPATERPCSRSRAREGA